MIHKQLQQIVENAREITGVPFTLLSLLNEETNMFEFKVIGGINTPLMQAALKVTEKVASDFRPLEYKHPGDINPYVQNILDSKNYSITNLYNAVENMLPKPAVVAGQEILKIKDVAAFPVIMDDQVGGIMVYISRKNIEESDIKVMQAFVNQVELLIKNIQRTAEMEDAQRASVKIMEDLERGRRESEEAKRFTEGILNSMSDIVIVLNLDGSVISMNSGFTKTLGYKPEDIIGKNFFKAAQWLKPEEMLKVMAVFGKAFEIGVFQSVELTALDTSGKEIPISVTGGVVKDREGNPQYIVVSIRDVTETRRLISELSDFSHAVLNMLEDLNKTSKQLAAAKEYTDNIINSMIDTLIVVDPNDDQKGRIKTINPATAKLLGYTEDELIGKPVATILAEEEEEEEEELFKGTRLRRLIKEKAVRDYDMKYRAKNGEIIDVSFSGSVMRDKRGKLVGIVGIARDMREIKELMEKEKEFAAAAAAAAAVERKKATELERAYRELSEAQGKLIQSEKLVSIGRLAAGVAHEINNPLASILLGVQRTTGMIKKQAVAIPDSEVYLKTLERVERATNQSRRIVAGLLAFSRPTKLELRPTDINKVIKEALEYLEDQVKAQEVRAVKRFAPRLPMIEADGQQLSQVFSNLITNACDAMPKGGLLKITTRLREPGPEAQREAMGEVDKTVEIQFSDTGKGISEEDMLRIFDPFFTTKKTGQGIGLGLSISYGIIEQHRGTIEAKSKRGEGSTFIVRIPVDARLKAKDEF